MTKSLQRSMDKYINDPKNDFSVMDMINFMKNTDNVIVCNEQLRNARTVSAVFSAISGHCTMYDYDTIEILIMSTKCKEAKKVITTFTNEFKKSCFSLLSDDDLRRKSDFQPTGSIQKLTIEYRGRDLEVKDIKIFKKVLGDHFDLHENCIQFIAAKVGSVQLIFEISLKVKEYLLHYKITAGAGAALFEYGINRLIINDEMELNMSAEYADKVSTLLHIEYVELALYVGIDQEFTFGWVLLLLAVTTLLP